jgi:FkbM family methyltransferase
MKHYGIEDIRLKHNLTKDSLVFEVGGWLGYFSEAIIKEFDCTVYIFEPVKSTYDNLVEKYKNNQKVKVFNFGLDNFTGTKQINICGDGTSLYKTETSNYENVIFLNINDFFKQYDIKSVDLVELNCEGSEYNILQEISVDNLNKINKLQIQFHDISCVNVDVLKKSINEKLKNTHNLEWYYSWFECWEKNKC